MLNRAILEEVGTERERQQTAEGFDLDHDDGHDIIELPLAAMAYCQSASVGLDDTTKLRGKPPSYWPWDADWWKPSSNRRDLVKAAALCLAAIERIDREIDRRG
jgi:hypothetical protein